MRNTDIIYVALGAPLCVEVTNQCSSPCSGNSMTVLNTENTNCLLKGFRCSLCFIMRKKVF